MQAAAEAQSWRLFLGLWPSPETRDALMRHQQQWQWPPGARPTPPERLHATVHFLGNVEVQRLPALRQALPPGWEGGPLELDKAEVWPGGIAVLEASLVPEPLARFHARLGETLAALGFPVETRRYRPHVTLARKGQGARPPAFAPIAWQLAPQYVLVRSLPGGGGYRPVQVFG